MKCALFAAALLAGCLGRDESEQMARQWGDRMGYETLAVACTVVDFAWSKCSLRISGSLTPISLDCGPQGCSQTRK